MRKHPQLVQLGCRGVGGKFENKISKEDIEKYREKIKKKLVKKVGKEITLENYKSLIGDKEMKYMFELYDKYFFKNELSKLAKELECMWVICWNHKCTKVGGRATCDIKGKCKAITIELSSKVFKNVIDKMVKDGNDYINMDNENRCDSVLSCMVLTFEHELVHGLQACFCRDWKTSKKGPGTWTGRTGPGSGHSKTFMSILNNTFGHVDYQHSLFSAGHKEESPKPKVEEPPKKKGLGDELEELQVEILKGVSKAEQKKKLKGKAKPENKAKPEKVKKLTPDGKKWVKAASEDMIERTKPKEKKKHKYSYDEQLSILTEFYGKVDKSKTDKEIKGILDRRRNKGFPIGTRLPTEPWLELCKKMESKYGINPLSVESKKKSK